MVVERKQRNKLIEIGVSMVLVAILTFPYPEEEKVIKDTLTEIANPATIINRRRCKHLSTLKEIKLCQ